MAERARSAVGVVVLSLLVSALAVAAAACRHEPDRRASDLEVQAPPPAARPPPPRAALTRDEQVTIEKVMAARDEIATIAEARTGE